MVTEFIEYMHDSERWIDIEVMERETSVFICDGWYSPSSHWRYFPTKDEAIAFRDALIAEWSA